MKSGNWMERRQTTDRTKDRNPSTKDRKSVCASALRKVVAGLCIPQCQTEYYNFGKGTSLQAAAVVSTATATHECEREETE